MRVLKTIVVPAAVFQSVIFGGAYGTGREVVEYITRFGGVDGFLALLAAALAFAMCLALSFDVARATKSYDYRTLLKQLVGPGWLVFEATFIVAVVLVLAINFSAAAAMLWDHWRVPGGASRVLLLMLLLALIALGRTRIQRCLLFCSMSLVMLLLFYVFVALIHSADATIANMTSQSEPVRAIGSGLQYAFYNLMAVPVIIYCARDIEYRREAWLAGVCAGLFGVLPAVLLHLTFVAGYPGILDAAVPVYQVITQLSVPGLMTTYTVVLLTMIICTMAGLLLGFNERVNRWWLESRGGELSIPGNVTTSALLLLLSLLLAEVGFVTLIARGFGILAWVVLVIFVLPLLAYSSREVLRSASVANRR